MPLVERSSVAWDVSERREGIICVDEGREVAWEEVDMGVVGAGWGVEGCVDLEG